jgi:2,4-dienoyl-CoA reductase-like NADH-dependent reductase (Old Yellow Enzyme family)
MSTAGFKTRKQALDAVTSGVADMEDIARAKVLNPRLAEIWLSNGGGDADSPRPVELCT